jgi:splicing factor 3B subunit 2
MQTPSGMETPSGMTSVVSTVAGGLETPDFLDLRKNAGVRALPETTDAGPRQLYQVVPEKQTAVRGLMGSERGYDITGLAQSGAPSNLPVLGQERGQKVSLSNTVLFIHLTFICAAAEGWCGRFYRRG